MIMRKSALLAFFLAVAFILPGGQPALADTVQVTFTGEYTSEDFGNWPFNSPAERLAWVDNIPVEMICDYDFMNDPDFTDSTIRPQGYEITDFLYPPENYPEGPPSRTWIFQAGEDLPDFEFWYYFDDDPPFGADLVGNTAGANYYSQITDTGLYVHFTDGVISADTWFGIQFKQLDGTDPTAFDPADLRIHPTPIPSALLLLGSGLVGLVGLRRFRKK